MAARVPAPRRRGAGALLASLAVHGMVVLALLWRHPVLPPPEPVPSVVEVDLRELPVEPPAPAWVGPPVPQEPAEPPRSAAPRRERHAATSPPAPRETTPPRTPAPPAEGPSLLRMRGPEAPRLALDDATVDRFARDGIITSPPVAPANSGTGAARPGKSKWQEKLALLEREGAARKNVAEGKVHPQIFDFMRDAEKVFTPRETVVEKDPRAPNTVGRTVQAWTRGFWSNYLDQLKRLARDEPAHKSALAETGAPDVIAAYERLLRAAEKGAEDIACQVCLVIRPGLPPEVMLAKSSGNPEIDRAATEALTRASGRRPQDGDLRPQRACYRFAATIARVPPLPIAGCSFDETKLKFGCFYPGKLVYKLRVSLDAVDYTGS
jgi:outer membrane biosynthesis protein TonB